MSGGSLKVVLTAKVNIPEWRNLELVLVRFEVEYLASMLGIEIPDQEL